MNRDIKGSKAIFLFPLTNHKYLNVYGQCRFRKKKSPTFCNKTVFCFFCLWVTGKEKCLCPSPWLCPDKSIACLHSVSLPALEGRKYFVRQKQLDKLSVCIVNFTWFLIDLVRGFIKCAHKGGKTETEQCWGKTENLVLLYFVVRRSQMMSMCGVTISSCLLYVSIQMKRVYKYKLCPKIIHAP